MKDVANKAIDALNQKDEDIEQSKRVALRWGRLLAIFFIVIIVGIVVSISTHEPAKELPNHVEQNSTGDSSTNSITF